MEAHITEQNCSFDTLNVNITHVLHRGGEKEKEQEEKRNERISNSRERSKIETKEKKVKGKKGKGMAVFERRMRE